MSTSLFLIGYRGSGKTTVGRLLAHELGWRWRDSDDEIEKREARSIAEIFAEDGETFFRDLESQIVCEWAAESGWVISLGGGGVLRPENRQALAGQSVVVYLSAPIETLYQRIHSDQSTRDRRPPLTSAGPMEEIRQLLSERSPLYQQCANLQIDTDGKSPLQICEEILHWLHSGSMMT